MKTSLTTLAWTVALVFILWMIFYFAGVPLDKQATYTVTIICGVIVIATRYVASLLRKNKKKS